MLSPWEHWTGQRSSTSHGGAACVNMCCGWMRTSHARLQLSHIVDNCFMYSCPTTRSTPLWYIEVPSLNSSIFIVFLGIWHMWLIGDTWDVWLFGFEVLRHDNKISRFSLITNYSKKIAAAAISMSQRGLRAGQVSIQAWGLYLKPADVDRIVPPVAPAPPVVIHRWDKCPLRHLSTINHWWLGLPLSHLSHTGTSPVQFDHTIQVV